MQQKRIFISFLACLLILLILSGFWFGKKKEKLKVYKIGAILPLTGNVALFGQWHKQGFVIALDRIKKEKILKGKEIKIIYGDSKNLAKEGVTLMNKFISVYKVPVVISAMSGVSKPLIPIADKNDVVLFLIDVTYPRITEESPMVFRHFIQSDREAKALAEYAIETLGIKRFATLYLEDETGLGAKSAFRHEVESHGGTITCEESFTKTGLDFRSQITKILQTTPEAVFIFGYGKSWSIVTKQLIEAGFEGQILANTVMWFPVFRKPLGKGAEGIIFTMPALDIKSNDPEVKYFVTEYKKRFHADPPLEAAYAYDALMLISKAISEKGYSAEGIRKGLLQLKNFHGAFGKISISPSGEIETPILIAQVKQSHIVILQKIEK